MENERRVENSAREVEANNCKVKYLYFYGESRSK